MTQFTDLTIESQNIVDNFVNVFLEKNTSNSPYIVLGSSLYAMRLNVRSSVTQILNSYIINLRELLTDRDLEVLNKEYTQVIMACFDQKPKNLQYYPYEWMVTPSSIVELCMRLTQPKSKSKVYLPYAGIGDFLPELAHCSCSGFEQDAMQWAISQIRIEALGSDATIEDVAPQAIKESNRFDYVFANLSSIAPYPKNGSIDHLTRILANNLSINGEVCAILPESICNSSNDSLGFNLRKQAQKSNASITVVSLSQVFSLYTGTNFCMLYLKNDGKGNIVLVDVDAAVFLSDQNNRRSRTINADIIAETLHSDDDSLVWRGTYADLTASLSILPNRYTAVKNKPIISDRDQFVKLGSLIEILPYPAFEVKKEKSTIGIKDLYTNYLDSNIILENGNITNTSNIIDNPCMLIGYIGGKFKVAKLEKTSIPAGVMFSKEVYPVILKSNIVTEEFLLRSFFEKYTADQAKKYSTGDIISRLSFNDLCEIEIVVPTIQEQNEICRQDTLKSLRDADRKILESHEDFRKDMHMKKHALGQTLANLKNWFKLIEQVRVENHGIIDDSVVFGRVRKVKVSDMFDNMKKTVEKLSIQLNKFDSGYGMEKCRMSLTEFIDKYICDNKSPLFKFQFDSLKNRASSSLRGGDYNEETGSYYSTSAMILEKGDPMDYIDFSPRALAMILDNIISNACAHGFKGGENQVNLVNIDVSTEGDYYILTISNNGLPLNADVATSDVLVYGQTSEGEKDHFGIGGYEVKRLMDEFGGDVEVISDPESEFPVSYRLIFKETNILAIL